MDRRLLTGFLFFADVLLISAGAVQEFQGKNIGYSQRRSESCVNDSGKFSRDSLSPLDVTDRINFIKLVYCHSVAPRRLCCV